MNEQTSPILLISEGRSPGPRPPPQAGVGGRKLGPRSCVTTGKLHPSGCPHCCAPGRVRPAAGTPVHPSLPARLTVKGTWGEERHFQLSLPSAALDTVKM
jgi:hypothetical protein